MRRIVSLLLSFMIIFALAACSQSAVFEKQEEIQPAFQKTDEQPETEADLYEIVPENLYTKADLAYYTNGRADQEQNDPSARLGIFGGVENMDEYDTIILGYAGV